MKVTNTYNVGETKRQYMLKFQGWRSECTGILKTSSLEIVILSTYKIRRCSFNVCRSYKKSL
jgi:hypothetical protein